LLLAKDVTAVHFHCSALLEFVDMPLGGVFCIITVDGRLQLRRVACLRLLDLFFAFGKGRF